MLASVTNQCGEVTSYEYEKYESHLNEIYRKGSILKSYADTIFGDKGVKLRYRLLTDIEYPTGARTKYRYEFVQSREGYCGILGGIDGMVLLNLITDYENTGIERGRSFYRYELYHTNLLPDSNEYQKKLYLQKAYHESGGRKDEYTFRERGILRVHTRYANGVCYSSSEKGNYYEDLLPREETVTVYENGKEIVSKYQREYDIKGNIISEILPLQKKSTTTYHSQYNYPIEKRYWKDDATELLVKYIPHSDGKKISRKEVFEITGGAPVRKEAVTYEYNMHNLREERHHADISGEVPRATVLDKVIFYSYDNTNPTLPSAIYSGIYVTSKSTVGVKNVNGQLVEGSLGCAPGTLTERFVYNTRGQVIETIDAAGRIAEIVYDRLGRITKKILPRGNKQEPEVSVQTSYSVRKGNHSVTVTNENGNITLYNYTSVGQLESIELQSPGLGHTPHRFIKENGYDNYNRLVQEVDYMGNGKFIRTQYAYDTRNRLMSKKIFGKNGALDYREDYNYNTTFDPAKGLYLEGKMIHGNGSAPSICSYVLKDILGRTVKEVAGDNAGWQTNNISTLLYSYDYAGNKTTQTDALNTVTAYAYDYAGRLLQETRQTEEGTVAAFTEYDTLGNKKVVTDFVSGNNRTIFQYDTLGRLIYQISPIEIGKNSETSFYYDQVGNCITKCTLTGRGWAVQGFTYDCQNRPIDSILHDGSTETRTRTEYIYGSGGASEVRNVYTGMKGDSLQGAAKTTYRYNRFGAVTSILDSNHCEEAYAYDGFGELQSKTDKNGNQIFYRYDTLNRLAAEGNRTLGYYLNGLKAYEENGTIRTDYHYDSRGRLTEQVEQCKTGSANFVHKRYSYDDCGNRSTFVLLKDGREEISLAYAYGKQNLLKSVSRGGVAIATYAYDANNQRKRLAYPQINTSTEYLYTSGGLISNLYHKKNGAHHSSYHYTYYPDGNQARKVAKRNGKPDKISDYSYDMLGRLLSEARVGASTTSYTFDSFGNRSQKVVLDGAGNVASTTAYKYTLCNYLETETKDENGGTEIYQYSYDKNGNQLSRLWERYAPTGTTANPPPQKVGFYKKENFPGLTFLEMREYNVFNQLISLYKDTVKTTYEYRPDGLRHRKSFSDGTSTTHVWDGSNMVAEYKNNLGISARYLRGLGLLGSDFGNGLQYYLLNAHGDVVEQTHTNGIENKQYEYDAFGIEEAATPEDSNPFRYCGEYCDEETQTIYLRARNYDPRIGRFTSEDPIRDGLNWYVYCGNNPVQYIDPTGCILQVASNSTQSQRDTILENLSMLTDYTLEYSGDTITISNHNNRADKTHSHGNWVIGQVINNDERTSTITMDMSYVIDEGKPAGNYIYTFASRANIVDGVVGTGSDSTIYFSPKNTPKKLVKGKNGNILEKNASPHISLGHELIHADHAMKGTRIPSEITREITYRNRWGTKVTKKVTAEELRTMGLLPTDYDTSGHGVTSTENGLRTENNPRLGKRVRYHD